MPAAEHTALKQRLRDWGLTVVQVVFAVGSGPGDRTRGEINSSLRRFLGGGKDGKH